MYNLGQKVVGKFTKLSKIGFSMKCFTAVILLLFTEKRQNLVFGWLAEYSPSNPSISGIFLKFSNFLRSEVLKSDSHLPNKILFMWFNESPLKMMKNAFDFILKALFVSKIFTFHL